MFHRQDPFCCPLQTATAERSAPWLHGSPLTQRIGRRVRGQLKALGSQPRLRDGQGPEVRLHEGSTRFCEGCGVARALKRAPHAVGDITKRECICCFVFLRYLGALKGCQILNGIQPFGGGGGIPVLTRTLLEPWLLCCSARQLRPQQKLGE